KQFARKPPRYRTIPAKMITSKRSITISFNALEILHGRLTNQLPKPCHVCLPIDYLVIAPGCTKSPLAISAMLLFYTIDERRVYIKRHRLFQAPIEWSVGCF